MPAKISKEVRQRIYELNEEGKPVKEIFSILKSKGIKISDKSIYNILKEKAKNRSLTSFDEEGKFPFDESFGDENKNDPSTPLPINKEHVIIDNDKILQEDNINIQNDIYSLINQESKKELSKSSQC